MTNSVIALIALARLQRPFIECLALPRALVRRRAGFRTSSILSPPIQHNFLHSLRSSRVPLSPISLSSMPVCRCSRCAPLTYVDHWGVVQHGQQQSSRINKQHFAEGRLRQMAEEEARAAVEGTILLETLKDLPGRPSGELPVRPADLPKRDQVSNQEEARVVKPVST